jgi:hypothetical protein
MAVKIHLRRAVGGLMVKTDLSHRLALAAAEAEEAPWWCRLRLRNAVWWKV